MNCRICSNPVKNGLIYVDGEVHPLCRDNAYAWMRRQGIHVQVYQLFRARLTLKQKINYLIRRFV